MNIALINLSPRANTRSVSGYVLCDIRRRLPDAYHIKMLSAYDKKCGPVDLSVFDALIIASPVYFDSLPAGGIGFLKEAESLNGRRGRPFVYFVSNSGFVDGDNNRVNIRILKNWCVRNGFLYRYSIAVGCGERLLMQADDASAWDGNNLWARMRMLFRKIASYDAVFFGKNLSSRGYEKTIERLVEDVVCGNVRADTVIRPFFPKTVFLTGVVSNLFVVIRMLGNGNTWKDLFYKDPDHR